MSSDSGGWDNPAYDDQPPEKDEDYEYEQVRQRMLDESECEA